jgi:hypothetical protein
MGEADKSGANINKIEILFLFHFKKVEQILLKLKYFFSSTLKKWSKY